MKDRDSLSLEIVRDEPLRFESELSVSASTLDREPLVSLSPLRLAGEVIRVEGGYALSGRLAYEGLLECSRCLEVYPFQEDESFTLMLYPKEKEARLEVELAPADLDAFYYDDPVVLLSPIVQERVQMALPMKPLCREDCLGLCAGCGTDLNLGSCACSREAIDPRWEALRTLKEKV